MKSVEHTVEAPAAGADGYQVKKEEAVEDCELAAVADGPEASRGMRLEVRDRHLSGEYKGYGTGEQAEEDQESTEGLENAGEPHLGEHLYLESAHASQPSEQLLDSVLGEGETGHDAKEGTGGG